MMTLMIMMTMMVGDQVGGGGADQDLADDADIADDVFFLLGQMMMMVGDEVGRGGASAWWDFKSGICNGILS